MWKAEEASLLSLLSHFSGDITAERDREPRKKKNVLCHLRSQIAPVVLFVSQNDHGMKWGKSKARFRVVESLTVAVWEIEEEEEEEERPKTK